MSRESRVYAQSLKLLALVRGIGIGPGQYLFYFERLETGGPRRSRVPRRVGGFIVVTSKAATLARRGRGVARVMAARLRAVGGVARGVGGSRGTRAIDQFFC